MPTVSCKLPCQSSTGLTSKFQCAVGTQSKGELPQEANVEFSLRGGNFSMARKISMFVFMHLVAFAALLPLMG